MQPLMEELLQEARGLQGRSVADSSKRAYESRIRVYMKCCEHELQVPAEPITTDKMMAFIVFQKRAGRCWSTLSNYIQGFSYYFRARNDEVLTQSMQFKVFKDGLRREMHAGTFPNAKLPFKPEWFGEILDHFPVTMQDNRRFMFLITLAFHGFLRMSELIALKKRDITLKDDRMEILIQSSKTDQFGHGQKTYIFDNGDVSSPFRYVDVLDLLEDDQHIVGSAPHTLRSHLHHVLTTIAVADPESYNFHSFRRGGAYLASCRGVADCVIKAHGRWKSSAYLRYVAVDMIRAGHEIGQALARRPE